MTLLDHDETRAERLEAECRQAMATLHPATWEWRTERRDELEFVDCILGRVQRRGPLMRLALTILGLDLFSIEIVTEDSTAADNGTDPGDCTTYPIGFAPSYGDQRLEPGVEFE